MNPCLSGASWVGLLAPPIVFLVITFLYYFGYGKEREE